MLKLREHSFEKLRCIWVSGGMTHITYYIVIKREKWSSCTMIHLCRFIFFLLLFFCAECWCWIHAMYPSIWIDTNHNNDDFISALSMSLLNFVPPMYEWVHTTSLRAVNIYMWLHKVSLEYLFWCNDAFKSKKNENFLLLCPVLLSLCFFFSSKSLWMECQHNFYLYEVLIWIPR